MRKSRLFKALILFLGVILTTFGILNIIEDNKNNYIETTSTKENNITLENNDIEGSRSVELATASNPYILSDTEVASLGFVVNTLRLVWTSTETRSNNAIYYYPTTATSDAASQRQSYSSTGINEYGHEDGYVEIYMDDSQKTALCFFKDGTKSWTLMNTASLDNSTYSLRFGNGGTGVFSLWPGIRSSSATTTYVNKPGFKTDGDGHVYIQFGDSAKYYYNKSTDAFTTTKPSTAALGTVRASVSINRTLTFSTGVTVTDGTTTGSTTGTKYIDTNPGNTITYAAPNYSGYDFCYYLNVNTNEQVQATPIYDPRWENPYSYNLVVTMPATAISYQAVYKVSTPTITANTAVINSSGTITGYNTGGTVSPTTSTKNYGYSSKFTATASSGYEFVEFRDASGNTLSTSNPYDRQNVTDETITACFAKKTTTTISTIIVNSSGVKLGDGGGSVTSGGTQISSLSMGASKKATLDATASTGYTFVGYRYSTSSSYLSTSSTYEYTMSDSNVTVYACFLPVTTTISFSNVTLKLDGTVESVTGGTLSATKVSGYYGTSTTVSTTPFTNYEFLGYGTSNDESSIVFTNPSTLFTFDNVNQKYYAIYRRKQVKVNFNIVRVYLSSSSYYLDVDSVLVPGTINVSGGTYQAGDVISISPTCNRGFKVAGYSSSATAINTKISMNLSNSYTVTATNTQDVFVCFEELRTSITIKTTGLNENSTIVCNDMYPYERGMPNLQNLNQITGFKITNFVIAGYDSGYSEYYDLSDNKWHMITSNTLPSTTGSLRYLSIDSDMLNLTINYERIKYKQTVVSNNTSFGNVYIKYNGSTYTNSANIPYEGSYLVYATAKTGYNFVGWYKDSACTDLLVSTSTYSVTKADSTTNTYYAKFEQADIHVNSSFTTNTSLKQFNNLKDAISHATNYDITNIYIEGDIGSLYQNTSTFINQNGNYVNYNSSKTVNVIGLGDHPIIYNNAANCLISISRGEVTFRNVTLYGTGQYKTSGNRDNALIRVLGGELTIHDTIITNNYNIGSGIHYVGDWCPGVIDVAGGKLGIYNSEFTNNTTTYGGDVFVHGGVVSLTDTSFENSYSNGLYMTGTGTKVTIKGATTVGTIYSNCYGSQLVFTDLTEQVYLYKVGDMNVGDYIADLSGNQSCASNILGVSGTTNLVAKLSNTAAIQLEWAEVTTTPTKSALQTAIEKASGKYTINLGESISLSSALGRYVKHVSGCLSIGSVEVSASDASVSGTGKRAVITGNKVGQITVKLNNVRTRGCYYYGTTTISSVTIVINVLPRIGDVSAGKDTVGVSNCTPNAKYELIDINGNVVATSNSVLDYQTGEYCVLFEGTKANTKYTIRVTSGTYKNTQDVSTPNVHALQAAIENASGFYINLGEQAYLSTILGRTVRHLSGCITVSNVKSSDNSYVTITGNSKNAVIKATKVGYVDITLSAKTRGWCAVYGTVSQAIDNITIRLYILPAVTNNPTITTTGISGLPNTYMYSFDGITYSKVTSFIGLTQNTNYTLYIKDTASNAGELIGTYSFKSKLNTANTTTMAEGIKNRIEQIKTELDDLNLSSTAYDKLVTILDKYYTDTKASLTTDELNNINEAIENLFEGAKEASNLDVTVEEDEKTTTSFEEYLTTVETTVKESITNASNVINSNANLVENVSNNKNQINDVVSNNSSTVDDYDNLVDNYESLTEEEKTALKPQLSTLLERYKTKVIGELAKLNLSEAEIQLFTAKVNNCTNIVEVYNEFAKAKTNSSINDILDDKNVSKSVVSEKLTTLQELDNTTRSVVKTKTNELYVSSLELIYQSVISSLETTLGVEYTETSEITKIDTITTPYKYNGIVYDTYKEAYEAALYAEEVLIAKLKVEESIKDLKDLITNSNLGSKICDTLNTNADNISKDIIGKIDNAKTEEDLLNIINELSNKIKVESKKIEEIIKVNAKANTESSKYEAESSTIIKENLQGKVETSKNNTITNILNDTSIDSITQDSLKFESDTKTISTKYDYINQINNNYNELILGVDAEVIAKLQTVKDEAISTILSNNSSILTSYQEVINSLEEMSNIVSSDSLIGKINVIKAESIAKVNSTYESNINNIYNKVIDDIELLNPSDSKYEEDTKTLIDKAISDILLEVSKYEEYQKVVIEQEKATAIVNSLSQIAQKEKNDTISSINQKVATAIRDINSGKSSNDITAVKNNLVTDLASTIAPVVKKNELIESYLDTVNTILNGVKDDTHKDLINSKIESTVNSVIEKINSGTITDVSTIDNTIVQNLVNITTSYETYLEKVQGNDKYNVDEYYEATLNDPTTSSTFSDVLTTLGNIFAQEEVVINNNVNNFAQDLPSESQKEYVDKYQNEVDKLVTAAIKDIIADPSNRGDVISDISTSFNDIISTARTEMINATLTDAEKKIIEVKEEVSKLKDYLEQNNVTVPENLDTLVSSLDSLTTVEEVERDFQVILDTIVDKLYYETYSKNVEVLSVPGPTGYDVKIDRFDEILTSYSVEKTDYTINELESFIKSFQEIISAYEVVNGIDNESIISSISSNKFYSTQNKLNIRINTLIQEVFNGILDNNYSMVNSSLQDIVDWNSFYTTYQESIAILADDTVDDKGDSEAIVKAGNDILENGLKLAEYKKLMADLIHDVAFNIEPIGIQSLRTKAYEIMYYAGSLSDDYSESLVKIHELIFTEIANVFVPNASHGLGNYAVLIDETLPLDVLIEHLTYLSYTRLSNSEPDLDSKIKADLTGIKTKLEAVVNANNYTSAILVSAQDLLAQIDILLVDDTYIRLDAIKAINDYYEAAKDQEEIIENIALLEESMTIIKQFNESLPENNKLFNDILNKYNSLTTADLSGEQIKSLYEEVSSFINDGKAFDILANEASNIKDTNLSNIFKEQVTTIKDKNDLTELETLVTIYKNAAILDAEITRLTTLAADTYGTTLTNTQKEKLVTILSDSITTPADITATVSTTTLEIVRELANTALDNYVLESNYTGTIISNINDDETSTEALINEKYTEATNLIAKKISAVTEINTAKANELEKLDSNSKVLDEITNTTIANLDLISDISLIDSDVTEYKQSIIGIINTKLAEIAKAELEKINSDLNNILKNEIIANIAEQISNGTITKETLLNTIALISSIDETKLDEFISKTLDESLILTTVAKNEIKDNLASLVIIETTTYQDVLNYLAELTNSIDLAVAKEETIIKINSLDSLSKEEKEEAIREVNDLTDISTSKLDEILNKYEATNDSKENTPLEYKNSLVEQLEALGLNKAELTNVPAEKITELETTISSIKKEFSDNTSLVVSTIDELFTVAKAEIEQIISDAKVLNGTYVTSFDQAIVDIKKELNDKIAELEKTNTYPDNYFATITETITALSKDTYPTFEALELAKESILKEIDDKVSGYELIKINISEALDESIDYKTSSYKDIDKLSSITSAQNAMYKKEIDSVISKLTKDINAVSSTDTISGLLGEAKTALDAIVAKAEIFDSLYENTITDYSSSENYFNTNYNSLNKIDKDTYQNTVESIYNNVITTLPSLQTKEEIDSLLSETTSALSDLKKAATLIENNYSALEVKANAVLDKLALKEDVSNDEFNKEVTDTISKILSDFTKITDNEKVSGAIISANASLDSLSSRIDTIDLENVRSEKLNVIAGDVNNAIFDITSLDTYQQNKTTYDKLIEKLNNVIDTATTNLGSATSEDVINKVVSDMATLVDNLVQKVENLNDLYEDYNSIRLDDDGNDLFISLDLTDAVSNVLVTAENNIVDSNSTKESDYDQILSEFSNNMKTALNSEITDELNKDSLTSDLFNATTEEEILNAIYRLDSINDMIVKEFGNTSSNTTRIENAINEYVSDILIDITTSNYDEYLPLISGVIAQDIFDNIYDESDIKNLVNTNIAAEKSNFDDLVTNDKYDPANTSLDKLNDMITVNDKLASDLVYVKDDFNNYTLETLNTKNESLISSLKAALANGETAKANQLLENISKVNNLYNKDIDETSDEVVINHILQEAISSVSTYIEEYVESINNKTDLTQRELTAMVQNNSLNTNIYDSLANSLKDEINYPKDKYDTLLLDTITKTLDSTFDSLVDTVKESTKDAMLEDSYKTIVDKYNSDKAKYDTLTAGSETQVDYNTLVVNALNDILLEQATASYDSIKEFASYEANQETYNTIINKVISDYKNDLAACKTVEEVIAKVKENNEVLDDAIIYATNIDKIYSKYDNMLTDLTTISKTDETKAILDKYIAEALELEFNEYETINTKYDSMMSEIKVIILDTYNTQIDLTDSNNNLANSESNNEVIESVTVLKSLDDLLNKHYDIRKDTEIVTLLENIVKDKLSDINTTTLTNDLYYLNGITNQTSYALTTNKDFVESTLDSKIDIIYQDLIAKVNASNYTDSKKVLDNIQDLIRCNNEVISSLEITESIDYTNYLIKNPFTSKADSLNTNLINALAENNSEKVNSILNEIYSLNNLYNQSIDNNEYSSHDLLDKTISTVDKVIKDLTVSLEKDNTNLTLDLYIAKDILNETTYQTLANKYNELSGTTKYNPNINDSYLEATITKDVEGYYQDIIDIVDNNNSFTLTTDINNKIILFNQFVTKYDSFLSGDDSYSDYITLLKEDLIDIIIDNSNLTISSIEDYSANLDTFNKYRTSKLILETYTLDTSSYDLLINNALISTLQEEYNSIISSGLYHDDKLELASSTLSAFKETMLNKDITFNDLVTSYNNASRIILNLNTAYLDKVEELERILNVMEESNTYLEEQLTKTAELIEEFRANANGLPSTKIDTLYQDTIDKINLIPSYSDIVKKDLEDLYIDIITEDLYNASEDEAINILINEVIKTLEEESLTVKQIDEILETLDGNIDEVNTSSEVAINNINSYLDELEIIKDEYLSISYDKILDMANDTIDRLQNNILTSAEVDIIYTQTISSLDSVETLEEQSFVKVKAEVLDTLNNFKDSGYESVEEIVNKHYNDIFNLNPKDTTKEDIRDLFETAKEEIVTKYKEELENSINEIKNSLDSSIYNQEKLNDVETIISSALNNLDNINSSEELKELISNLNNSIDSVETLVDLAIVESGNEIDSLVEELVNNNNLTDEEILKLNQFVEENKQTITGSDLATVEQTTNNLKEEINELVTSLVEEAKVSNVNALISEYLEATTKEEKIELKEQIDSILEDSTLDKTNVKLDEYNLAVSKENAKDELEELLENTTLNDYSAFNQDLINDTINQAIIDITSSSDLNTIDSLVNTTKENIGNIPTLVDEAVEDAKANALIYLDKFNDGGLAVTEKIAEIKELINNLDTNLASDIEELVKEKLDEVYISIIKDIENSYNDESLDSIFDSYLSLVENETDLNTLNNILSELSNFLDVRDTALEEINNYNNNGLTLSGETLNLINTAITDIKGEDSITDINTVLNYHTNLIDKQILSDEKTSAINEVNSHFDVIDSTLYTGENYLEITNIKNQAIEQINTSTNLTNVNRTKENAIKGIDDVLTIVEEGKEEISKLLDNNSSDEVISLVEECGSILDSLVKNEDGKYVYNGTEYDDIASLVEELVEATINSVVDRLKVEAIENAINEINTYKNNLVSLGRFSQNGISDMSNLANTATNDLNSLDKAEETFYDKVDFIVKDTKSKMKDVLAEFTTTKDQNTSKTDVNIDYPSDYNIKDGLWGNVQVSKDILPLEVTLVVEKQEETYLSLAKDSFIKAKEDDTIGNTTIDLAKSEVKELLDIYLMENNKRVSFTDNDIVYTVRILIPESYRAIRELSVVHIKDDGSIELFTAERIGNFLEFETSHFSDYALVGMTYTEQTREEQFEEATNIFNNIDSSIYTHEEWQKIKDIYEETIKSLEGQTISAPDMINLVIQLVEEINETPTALDISKEQSLEALENEFMQYNKSDYTESDYKALQEAYEKAKAEILKAESITEVEQTLEVTRTTMKNTITVGIIVRNVMLGVIAIILGIILILFIFYFRVIIYDNDEKINEHKSFFLIKVRINKLNVTKEGYNLEGIYLDKELKNRAEDFRLPFGRVKLYANFILDSELTKYGRKVEVKTEKIENSFVDNTLLEEAKTKIKKQRQNDDQLFKDKTIVKKVSKGVITYEAISNEDLKEDTKNIEVTEEVKPNVILKDYTPLVNYSISFEAKLALGDTLLQDYYNAIKNKVMSYNVKERMSFKKETFYLGRNTLLVLQVRGKTIKAYIALSLDELLSLKLKAELGKEKFAQETNLALVKVTSSLQLKRLLTAIELLMQNNEISINDDYSEIDYLEELKCLTKNELISMGKIKLYESKKVTSINAYEVSNYMSDEELANVEIAEEEVKEVKGQKGIINIDTISKNFNRGDIVDLKSLKEKNLVGKNVGYIKILARGVLDKELEVKANAFSSDAMKMILLTGGKVVLTIKEEN